MSGAGLRSDGVGVLPFARLASRRDLDCHLVVAGDAEDLRFTGAGRRQTQSRLGARLHCGHTRERADVIRGPRPALGFAKTAHAAHRERLGPTGGSSANRGPDSCKHRSSYDSADRALPLHRRAAALARRLGRSCGFSAAGPTRGLSLPPGFGPQPTQTTTPASGHSPVRRPTRRSPQLPNPDERPPTIHPRRGRAWLDSPRRGEN